MDDKDRKILNELQKDGRMSYAEVGRKIGMSRATVRKRVNKLKEKGIIEKFTVIIDTEKTGRNLSAFFEIEVDPNHLDKVANRLAEEEKVRNLYLMTGASTLHMHSLLKDHQELEKFLLNKIYSQDGINKVRSNIILKRYKNREGGRNL
jgi:DNA-binding Lrp family transcriptional regulator